MGSSLSHRWHQISKAIAATAATSDFRVFVVFTVVSLLAPVSMPGLFCCAAVIDEISRPRPERSSWRNRAMPPAGLLPPWHARRLRGSRVESCPDLAWIQTGAPLCRNPLVPGSLYFAVSCVSPFVSPVGCEGQELITRNFHTEPPRWTMPSSFPSENSSRTRGRSSTAAITRHGLTSGSTRRALKIAIPDRCIGLTSSGISTFTSPWSPSPFSTVNLNCRIKPLPSRPGVDAGAFLFYFFPLAGALRASA